MSNFEVEILYGEETTFTEKLEDKGGWEALILNAPDGNSYIIYEDCDGEKYHYMFPTEEDAKKEWEYTKKASAKHSY
jgi:hypothetical protein